MCPSPDCKYPSFYRQITEVLNDSNLTQTVSISTRDSNILDLFFTTNPTFVKQVSILQGISNHGSVQIQVNTFTFAGKYVQPQNMLHLAFADITRQQLLNQTTSHWALCVAPSPSFEPPLNTYVTWPWISYNNERSGILIFYFESVSSLSNKKIAKTPVDGHLGELSSLASFSTAGGCLFCGTVKSRM